MDHHMDHSHHSHMAHSMDNGADAQYMCSMNMLFTWSTRNLCIVFRWWHIGSTVSLVLSLLAIVVIGMGYEALREGIRRFEVMTSKRAESVPPSETVTETTPFLWSGQNRVEVSRRAHVIKAVLYGIQNFYAFMIMLIFMTYNGWVMIAVTVGSSLGYLIFGGKTTATKDTACH